MNHRDWKAEFERLEQAHKKASSLDSEAFKAMLAHKQKLILQYTLPSGTRTTISGLGEDSLQITSANHDPGFLTLGMLSVEDLEVFLEIRKAIRSWMQGEVDDLPWPARPFAHWRRP